MSEAVGKAVLGVTFQDEAETMAVRAVNIPALIAGGPAILGRTSCVRFSPGAPIYFGSARDNLKLTATKTDPQNIVSLPGEHALENDKTYYWRVDTKLADGSAVEGDVWSFATTAGEELVPPQPKPKARRQRGRKRTEK